MSRFKTELCNNLIELGTCKYGDRCHYAHGAHELRQVSRRHPKYRTERCKNFELTGKCPFGPRCSYVHPKPDLDSMIQQLTRYVQHTKAPKPESEDDEDDNISLFTRTATSASLYSTCESTSSNSNQFLIDEANKENQLVVNYPKDSSASSAQDYNPFKSNKLNYIGNPFVIGDGQHHTSALQAQQLQPLNGQANQQEQVTPIQLPQPRLAMRTLTSNINQTLQQETETNLNSSPTTQSSSSAAASNPFGINNPLSDYFNSANLTTGNSLTPNKQFYTRF